MIDNLINESFNLDYDVFQITNFQLESYQRKLNNTKISNSETIKQQFDKFLDETKDIFSYFYHIFNLIDSQRKVYFFI